ncbi:MAG: CoA transferase [Actinobacteria bacterium]|nr:CoA transferase [Actinomycetota bacterium]
MDPGSSATDPSSTATGGPLADLRVLELGQLLAGPFCGQLLGDFGAEVVKVERPGTGDPMRQWGRQAQGLSLWWPVIARNKKSITCDLGTGEGQALTRRLVATADVVVENFRPGRLERWNLGYEELARINPGVILVRVTGYGQSGPYAPRAGFGSVGEAMGGLRHVTGEPDRPPSRTGVSIGDSLAGTLAALGALVAVHARRSTGRGQVVDSAIYEAVLALMESLVPEYQVAGHVRQRSGAILPGIAPSNVYTTGDGDDVVMGANQDSVFRRLAEVMGQPHLATDPRFATHAARGENQAELDRLIGAWTAGRKSADLLEDLARAGVPAGRIYTARDLLADPHVLSRQAIVHLAHPEFGTIAMQGVAPRLSETPGSVRWPGPALGGHNDEIYGALGLDAGELTRLRDQGVL